MQTYVSVHLDGGEQVQADSIIGRPDKGVIRIGDVTIFGTITQLDALLDQLASLRTVDRVLATDCADEDEPAEAVTA